MPAGQPPKTLADKINWLIHHMWPREIEVAKSDAEISAALQRVTKEEISRSTLWKLRTGRQPNPTLRTLKALAAFFRVPIGYFGDDEQAERIEEQLTLLALMRDGGIGNATLRTLVDLSPEGKRMIGEIIASTARKEQDRSARPPDHRNEH